MKVSFDIFIPEKGGQKDIKFGKKEYEPDCSIEIYPLPFELNRIEMYVDESGVYNYVNFNMLAFDFICLMEEALKSSKDIEALNNDIINVLKNPPRGPVWIIVKDKKMYEELHTYFTKLYPSENVVEKKEKKPVLKKKVQSKKRKADNKKPQKKSKTEKEK